MRSEMSECTDTPVNIGANSLSRLLCPSQPKLPETRNPNEIKGTYRFSLRAEFLNYAALPKGHDVLIDSAEPAHHWQRFSDFELQEFVRPAQALLNA